MSKYPFYIVAALVLALSSGVRADDQDPTLGERVGYALSLARDAAHGDKKALATLQTNASMDAAAEFGLGEYYYFTKDYPQSLAWLKKSADHGFPGGYYGLGKAYQFGDGVTRDYAQAMRLYLQATALPEAEMHIGDLYSGGQGVERDMAQSMNWYKKAAEGGSIKAAFLLGYRYETGLEVKPDPTQALLWYRKAADQGDAEAQYRVGHVYAHPGPLQDYKQAAEWYQKASQQGLADAQLGLGELYSSGKGVPADAHQAAEQFQMAANQGQPQAQCRLAQAFADGSGVPADLSLAYQWFALTQMWPFNTEQGCEVAPKRMQQLERQLGPAQVAQAKQAADAWRDKFTSTEHKQDDLPPF